MFGSNRFRVSGCDRDVTSEYGMALRGHVMIVCDVWHVMWGCV